MCTALLEIIRKTSNQNNLSKKKKSRSSSQRWCPVGKWDSFCQGHHKPCQGQGKSESSLTALFVGGVSTTHTDNSVTQTNINLSLSCQSRPHTCWTVLTHWLDQQQHVLSELVTVSREQSATQNHVFQREWRGSGCLASLITDPLKGTQAKRHHRASPRNGPENRLTALFQGTLSGLQPDFFR